ncbi:hypothetical protein G6L37_00090 [Agrobacterium rubi]|nr:hypothetical protein [Agrobacterium rubi]NTF23649.1 hypothetical protein [Agrobacterium rubi]
MQKIDFVKLEFDDETQGRLFEFCRIHKLGLADCGDPSRLTSKDFKFHVTIMYSAVTSQLFREGEFRLHVPCILTPVSYDMFGPENDKLVVLIDPRKDLSDLFEHYGSTFGHVSDFTPFRPHLTIRGTSAGAKDRMSTLPLPDFALRANRLIHKVKTV